MNYSYTNSLINITAAFTKASYQRIDKHGDSISHITSKYPIMPNLFFKKISANGRVGIKFVNLLAEKYFATIHGLRVQPLVNKATEKPDELRLTESHVTSTNVLRRIEERNWPPANRQSTFL